MKNTIPLPCLKVESTRDAIIQVLSKKWPLSLKDLTNEINSDLGLRVSSQAIFKALNVLIKEKLISKENSVYYLDKAWILNVKKFADFLNDSYSKNKIKKPVFVDLTTTNLSFNSVWETYNFILSALDSNFFDVAGKGFGCAHFNHMYDWFPLAGSKTAYDKLLSIAKKNQVLILCNGNSFVDKWVAKYYENFGWKVKTDVKCSFDCDLFVHGNTVVQIFFPANIKKALDKSFSNVKSIFDLNIPSFYNNEAFHLKSRISVVITRNPVLAKEIFDSTKKHFR